MLCSFCTYNKAEFVCSRCLRAIYCSEHCQEKAWSASHAQICSIQGDVDACPALTKSEELVLKFMTPNCPDKFALTQDRLDALRLITKNSSLFSDAFKQTVYARLDNFFAHAPISIYKEKETKTVIVPLASLNGTTADYRIRVKGACKKLFLLKSTETCRNDVDIRLRVIDLNNLQRYAANDKYLDAVRATCTYEKAPRPTIFGEVGTCKKTFSFGRKTPRYIVLVHHHFFDQSGNDRFLQEKLNDPAPFIPYGSTPELSTVDGLMAKVEFYTDKDAKKNPAKETVYQLTLYYQNAGGGGGGKQIFGPEDVPFEYNLYGGGAMKILKK